MVVFGEEKKHPHTDTHILNDWYKKKDKLFPKKLI